LAMRPPRRSSPAAAATQRVAEPGRTAAPMGPVNPLRAARARRQGHRVPYPG
jgi:hypothetical protein